MELFPIFIAVIVSLIAGVVGVIVMYLAYIHSQYDHIPGPPRESFFSGNCKQMARSMSQGKTSCEVFLEWAKQYGQTYVIWNYHIPTVMTVSQQAIKDLCVDGKHPVSRKFIHWFQYIFGERSVKDMVESMNNVLDSMITYIEPKADGKIPFDLRRLFARAANDIMTSGVFGQVPEDFDKEHSSLTDNLHYALVGFDMQMKDSGMEKIFFWRNRALRKKARQGTSFFRQATCEWVKGRIQEVKNAEQVPKNALSAVAKSFIDFGLSIDEATDDITNLYFAGQDTTASTASLAFLELCQHQDITKRVQDEIDDVIGSSSHVSYEDLSQLDLLQRVMKETLRKYPTFPFHYREVGEDNFHIDGYIIPKGTMVQTNIFVAQNLPENFKDPDIFNPERFKDNNSYSPYIYFPFLLGPRICIGQTFAKVAVKMMVAKLLQKFNFQHTLPRR